MATSEGGMIVVAYSPRSRSALPPLAMAFYFISSYFDGGTHIMVLAAAAAAASKLLLLPILDCCFLSSSTSSPQQPFFKTSFHQPSQAKYVKDKKLSLFNLAKSVAVPQWAVGPVGSRRIIRYNFCLIIYAREAGGRVVVRAPPVLMHATTTSLVCVHWLALMQYLA